MWPALPALLPDPWSRGARGSLAIVKSGLKAARTMVSVGYGVATLLWLSMVINRARPTPPTQTLWNRDPETLFRLKIEKTKRFVIFNPPKRGAVFCSTFLTPPPAKKWVSSGGGV